MAAAVVTGIFAGTELLARAAAGGILAMAALAVGRAIAAAILGSVRAGGAVRLAAVATATLWSLTALFHLLLALHAFGLALALPILVGGALLTRRRGSRSRLARLVARWWRTGRWRQPWILGPGFVVLVSAARMLFVPPVAWDAQTYHLVKAAMWVREGGPFRFPAPGGGGVYVYVSGGVDVLWAWVMLPFHSDLLVGVADVAGFLALGVGTYALGRELGLRPRIAALGAASLLAMPAVLLAVGSNYVDTMVAFYLVSATAFALRFLRGGPPCWALFTAMAAGLAAGSKLTAVPTLAVFLLFLALPLWRRHGVIRGGRFLIAATILALVVSAPWHVRSWIDLGRPFSPFPVRVAGLVLGEADPNVESYAHMPIAAPYTVANEGEALVKLFHAPFANGLGATMALAFLALPFGLVSLWRRQRSGAVLVVAQLAVAAQAYLSPQFSVTRMGWADGNGRYFLTAVALAVLLALRVFPRPPLTTLFGIAIGVNLWGYGGRQWTPLEFSLVLGYLSLLAVLASAWSSLRSSRSRRIAAGPFVLILLLVAGYGRERYRHTLAVTSTVLHEAPRVSEEALAAVDGPTPLRIAFTSGPYVIADNWLLYPFLGSRLQNEPVYVPISRSGRFVPHTAPDYATDADVDGWIARLRERRVDAVVSFWPPGPELDWMEARPEVFRRAGGEAYTWGVYRLVAR